MQLRLDRLTLRVSGLSPSDGRRLVELVGHRLAAASPPPGGPVDAMNVTITPSEGESLESLSQRIVDEMLRSFARSQS